MAKKRKQKPSLSNKVKFLTDGFQNTLTGLGTSKDSITTGGYAQSKNYSDNTLTELYLADGIAKRVVDRPVKDAVLSDYYLRYSDGDEERSIRRRERLEELLFDQMWSEGKVNARVVGGSLIYMNIDDGRRQDSPVDLRRIRSGGITSLVHIQKSKVQVLPEDVDTDIFSPGYNMPILYTVLDQRGQPTQVKIHRDRVLVLDGALVPDNRYKRNGYWHNSVLSDIYTALSYYNQAIGNTATMAATFGTTVLKLKGLSEQFDSNTDSSLVSSFKERVNLITSQKSVWNAVVIDEEEQLEQLRTELGQYHMLLNILQDDITARTQLPHNLIWGDGSTGNTEGRQEVQDYELFIKHIQQHDLKPALSRVIEILDAADRDTGRRVRFYIDFGAVYKPTRLEDTRADREQALACVELLKYDALSFEEVRAKLGYNGGRQENGLLPDPNAVEEEVVEEEAAEDEAREGESDEG